MKLNGRITPLVGGPFSKFNPYRLHDPEAQRMIRWHLEDGLTLGQIARRSGWNINTVSKAFKKRGVRVLMGNQLRNFKRRLRGVLTEPGKPCLYCGRVRRNALGHHRIPAYCGAGCKSAAVRFPATKDYALEADGHWWVTVEVPEAARVRLAAWIMYRETGEWVPRGMVVLHRNGDKDDCRLENLRFLQRESAVRYYQGLTPEASVD